MGNGAFAARAPRRAFVTAVAVVAAFGLAPGAGAALTSGVFNDELTVASDAGDAIAISCVGGNVKVNGVDPDSGAASCSSLTRIEVSGGPGANSIDLTGIDAAFTQLGDTAPSSYDIWIAAGGGADSVIGGPLAERIDGDGGADVLRGGGGRDTLLNADPGDDSDGQADADLLVALFGNLGNGTITIADTGATPCPPCFGDLLQAVGTAGDDTGATKLLLVGNQVSRGTETVAFSGIETPQLYGEEGNDTLDASAATMGVFLRGGIGDDTLTGGSGNDSFSSETGDDNADGRDGSDLYNIDLTGAGLYTVADSGAAGSDAILSFGDSDPNTFHLNATTLGSPSGTRVAYAGVENVNVTGGGGDDVFAVISSSAAGLWLNGQAGSDDYGVTWGALAGPVTVQDNGPASPPDVDELTISCAPGVVVTATQVTNGSESIGYSGLEAPPACGTPLEDVTKPLLSAFSVNPTSVDVTGGPAAFTSTVTLTDDLSGLAEGADCSMRACAQVMYSSPSGGQTAWAIFARSAPGSSIWTATTTIPEFAEAGIWKPTWFIASDKVGNTLSLGNTELIAAGFNVTIGVTSVADTTPPALGAFSINPTSIDVTNAPAGFTATVTLTDAGAGVSDWPGSIQFSSPSGKQQVWVSLTRSAPGSSVFTGSADIARYAEAGVWKPTWLSVQDRVGNRLSLNNAQLVAAGYAVELTVADANPDVTPPSLTAFSITPTSIDVTTGAATVTVSATLTDDLAGMPDWVTGPCNFLSCPQILFASESGGQNAWALISRTAPGSNTFTGTLVIPQFSEAGIWTPMWFVASDHTGNTLSLSNADLVAAGFDVELGVKKSVSGFVPAGGTLSTDSGAPTAGEPLVTSITPTGGASIVLEESFITGSAPTGWSFVGQQVNITAPAAAGPFTIVFTIHSSLFPAAGPSAISISRNGAIVPACSSPTPTPDPCEVSRALVGGNLQVTVKTSAASFWNVAIKTNAAPDCSSVGASSAVLWPPNGQFLSVRLEGGSDPDGDAVTMTITGVTQDEPVSGLGRGDKGPDARLLAGSPRVVQLRAERAGGGDGRVYRIAYELSDGIDTCTGTALVTVPHDRSGHPAVDSGGAFDSLG